MDSNIVLDYEAERGDYGFGALAWKGKRSSFGLLMLDLWIIWRGVMVIVKGGGH